jgi:hypothetical protein
VHARDTLDDRRRQSGGGDRAQEDTVANAHRGRA